MFSSIKNIHFIGIGGIGMSGIAEVLLNLDYVVSGSDIKSSAIVKRLEELGAKITIGHDSKLVRESHVVIVSSAINKHNPELIEAANLRIPIIHRSEMLAELMRMKYGILVAGTHGKTTTTSILATVLTDAKLDPTVVIGGKLNAINSNAKMGRGDLFVAEADESDGSFLRLTPTIAVITNVDRDHMDHYPNFDAIVSTFRAFVEKVPFYGSVCACIDDPGVQLLLPHVRRRLITFGLRPDADVTARNITLEGFTARFTPVIFGKPAKEVVLHMPGRYNISNALASFAVAHVLDLDPTQTVEAIGRFEGVNHRFTILGEHQNITVIDDYAHNPKKIETVLQGTREAHPNAHIVAVFQPHRYSRLKYLWDEFAHSFVNSDAVIITPIYTAGEQAIPGITTDALASQIRIHSFHNTQGKILVADSLKSTAQLAADAAKTADPSAPVIVLTLGAGDVASVGQSILENLKRNA